MWLINWNKRKSKIVNGTTAGAQANYQMRLNIYKGSGIDTPINVYIGNNVKNDFGDLRFTDSDGVTLLDYWIESFTLGISAVVWIKIPFIPAYPSNATIYIYYDNPVATSMSNGKNTFIFFDDFETRNLAGWTITEGSWTAANGYAQGNCGHCGAGMRKDAVFNLSSGMVRHKGRFPILDCRGGGVNYANPTGTNIFWYGPDYCVPWGGQSIMYLGITGYGEQRVPRSGDTAWHEYKVTFVNSQFKLFYDGTNVITMNGPAFVNAARVSIGGWQHQNPGSQWDDMIVQNYTDPEPTFGSVGPEELPNFGNIFFDSIPQGANIFLDGEDTGQITPATITNIPVGTHTYMLSKANYYNYENTIEVIKDQTVNILATLIPKTGNIFFDSVPQGANILLNGEDTGQVTPVTITDIPVGTHTYTLSKTNYYNYEGTVEVIAGQTVNILATLVPRVGNIFFDSVPQGAKIFVDEIDTGKVTPATINNVEAGTRTYRLSKWAYFESIGSVEVIPDTTISIFVTMSPMETGCQVFNSVPENSKIIIDGLDFGIYTPIRMCGIPLGTHTYSLQGEFVIEKEKKPIIFVSVPKGARIIIDGIDQGVVTPEPIRDIYIGVHTYRLEGIFTV